jgi:hypothetical protein
MSFLTASLTLGGPHPNLARKSRKRVSSYTIHYLEKILEEPFLAVKR